MSENHEYIGPTAKGDADAKAEAEAEARSAEAAAIRRRWITLGEALAVVAVVISGLTLWNNWSERAENEATSKAQARQASVRSQLLVLTASPSDQGALALKPASLSQSVQAQSIQFPGALGLAPVQTTGEPRIEAAWFAQPLKKAREHAGMPDDSRGDERLPVAITTTYLVDGRTFQDVAIYDIGYTIAGRWLAGHTLRLRGVSLVSHVTSETAQASVDKRWNRLLPAKGS